jgi:hypothetical protein
LAACRGKAYVFQWKEVSLEARSMPHKTSQFLAVGALILAIGAVHVLARRSGHDWGGDFAQYVHHAKNLVEGVPYADTGYLYNRGYPQIGPPAYPPGTALLLAPVYWAAGLNLEAMKGAMVACLLVFLLAVFLCFRDDLPLGPAATLVAVLGLNHFFLAETNQIRSDLPFLAILYLAMFLIRRGEGKEGKGDVLLFRRSRLETAGDPGPAEKVEWPFFLAAGVAAYLAYATRTVGGVLMPALVLADLLRTRRITRPVLLACLAFGCLAAAQAMLLEGSGGYLDQFGAAPSVLLANASAYATQMAAFWHNGYSKPLAVAVFTAVTLLAFLGYAASVRRHIGTCEVFIILYPLAIFLWPSYQGVRFLYPILPLYLFYALKGLEHPWLARRAKLRRATIASLAAAVAVSYAAMATTMEFGPLGEGVAKPESVALFDYVRRHTDPDDVVIFVKPRVMSLFAGRVSSVYHQPEDDRELWAYFDRIGARWLVVVENDAAFTGAERPEVLAWLRRFAKRNEPRLARVWGNADFTVYRILTPRDGLAIRPTGAVRP